MSHLYHVTDPPPPINIGYLYLFRLGTCKYINYRDRGKCTVADATKDKEHLLYANNPHLTKNVIPLHREDRGDEIQPYYYPALLMLLNEYHVSFYLSEKIWGLVKQENLPVGT